MTNSNQGRTVSNFKSLTKVIFLVMTPFLLTHCSVLSKKDKRGLELDHVAIVVDNMDRASGLYRGPLGFSMTRGWAHQSPQAALAAFKDGSYIQLVSSDTVHSGLARWYGQLKSANDPGNIVALRTGDVEHIKERANNAGIPFQEGTVRGSDGSDLFEVISFTDYEPLAFLVIIQYDEAFYNEFFRDLRHRNQTRSLQEAWILVDNLNETQTALNALGLHRAGPVVLQPLRSHATSFQLQLGQLILADRSKVDISDLDALSSNGPEVAGMSFQVPNIERMASHLDRYSYLRYATTRYNGKSCILVPPKYSGGIWLELAR